MNEHRLADDLIRGAKQIGEELGLSPAQVFYLHKHRLLPTFLVGTTIHVRRTKLREHYAKLEEAAQPAEMVA
jgi:hypothetical protein